MKHLIKLTRTYTTFFDIEAESVQDAVDKFNAMGDDKYVAELEQCNIDESHIVVLSEPELTDEERIRICDVTGEEMTEGWVVNDGEKYFKYEHDAYQWCKDNGYHGIQSAFDDDVMYWTSWED